MYRRLKKQQGEPAETPALPDTKPAANPAAAGTPAKAEPNAGSKSPKGLGISFEEQVQIIGQINQVLQRNRLQIQPDTFEFTPRKKGSLIPILINAGAALVTLVAAIAIVLVFNAGERSLVSRSAVVLSTESKLIQALKKESEEQLAGKDREIQRIQGQLSGLARERDRLQQETQVQLQRREAELKAGLEKELAAERQKLERAGLAEAAIDRQLADLESRLAASSRRQLEELRRQADSELAAKDASLAELTAQLRARTAATETERGRLAEQTAALASLREQRQREQLVNDQLLSAYGRVMEAVQTGRYDEALAGLDSVEELLARESVRSLPAVQSRLPHERFVLASLRRLFESERGTAAADGQLAAAQRERTELAAELAKARRELALLQSGEQRRQTQESQLKALQDRIAAQARGATAEAQAQMLALLETKLRVQQVLAAEPARSQHPGLFEQLEKYLDAYGREQRQEGQAAALQDLAALLEGLDQRIPRADARRLRGEYSGSARENLTRLLERLRSLLR